MLKTIWGWLKKPESKPVDGIQNQNSPNSGNQVYAPISASNGGTVKDVYIGDTHHRHGLSVEDAMKLAEKLVAADKGEKDAQIIQSLQQTIQALEQVNANKSDIKQAFDWLAKGDATKVEAIFAAVAEEKERKGKQANIEAAEALRHLGSLAFLHDTQKAYAAYKRSTELDPGNWDGWNNLGHLYRRTGELEKAQTAYTKAQKLSPCSNKIV